tara:strand:- start:448 stop:1698 length:1251 start_codon:yes stop_codon:yes gene_type:complete
MGGGLMQLVAYGAQDIYLTGNPQITFFKVVYRRHTNFSMESIKQTFDGTVGFGNTVSATISRNGDLVQGMHIEFSPGDFFINGQNIGVLGSNVGHSLIKEVEIEIGGQKIDKHYSHWLSVYEILTENTPLERFSPTQNTLLEPANASLYQKLSYNHNGQIGNNLALLNLPERCFIPLRFWFCRNPGLALPLIALQYHEVKIQIIIGDKSGIVQTPGALGEISHFELWADYIYLDTDERRRFAQVSHEYLIEQLQLEIESSGTATKKNLNFNHPVKELIFTGRPRNVVGNNYVAGPATPSTLASGNYQLKLNGHDRFKERNRLYFTRMQMWQHHGGECGASAQKESIGVYSFALKPDEHQPSGTCNFSRIDNAEFIFPARAAVNAAPQASDGGLNIYAVNYNVLRIMSGMGGLAYSN